MDGQNVMRAVVGLITGLLVSSFAPPAHGASKNYYQTDVVIQEAVSEEYHSALAIEVYKRLAKTRIQHLTIRGSAVGNLERQQFERDTIEALPMPVLLALRLGCMHSNPFSTWNILVPMVSGDAIPANITRPDKTHLVIELGEVFRTTPVTPPPSEAEIRRRYGIRSTGKLWTNMDV